MDSEEPMAPTLASEQKQQAPLGPKGNSAFRADVAWDL